MAAAIANSFGLELDDLSLYEEQAASYDMAALAGPALSPGVLGGAAGGAGTPSMPAFRREGGAAGNRNLASTLVNALWGTPKRKTATTSGGVLGMIATGIIMLLITGSGPASIINLGMILQRQFAGTEFASQTRMGRMIVDMFRSPELGDSRLNLLEVKIKNSTLKNLADKGIAPSYDTKGKFQGFELDPSVSHSPYNELYKSAGDAIDTGDGVNKGLELVRDNILNDKALGKLDVAIVDGKILMRGENGLLNNSAIAAIASWMTRDDFAIVKPVSFFLRFNTLGKFYITGSLHWIRNTKNAINAKIDDLKLRFIEWIKNGTQAPTANGVEVQTTDPNGNKSITKLDGGKGTIDTATAKSFLSDPVKFTKGGVGVLAAASAIVCLSKVIDDNYNLFTYGHVFVPLMREATVPLSIAGQAMSGQDMDASQVGTFANNYFTKRDPKTGQTISTWYDSAPIRALVGAGGGIDMNQTNKDLFGGPPGWLSWTQSDVVKTACSSPVQTGVMVISVGTLLLPGVDVVSELAGAALSAGASVAAITLLSNIIHGDAIDTNASGADWGNNIAYGSRLLSNQNALGYGAVQLTDQQSSQLAAITNAQDKAQFQSLSLADRLFNPTDYRSLVGTMIDSAGIYSLGDLIAKMGSLPNILGSLMSLPSSLISGTASAVSTSAPTQYKYPFAEFGFSTDDLNNPLVSSPSGNAAAVAQILNNEAAKGKQTYINKALDCFGVSITKGADGWDATTTNQESTDGQDRTYGVNAYDNSHYSTSDCIDSGNDDWLRIRVWLLDTGTLEGWACTQGDEASCVNSGMDVSYSSGSAVTGNVQFYSQRDPRWASKQVGGDGWKGSWAEQGCYFTDKAMAYSTLASQRITPDMTNYVDSNGNQIIKHAGDYGLKDTGIIYTAYNDTASFNKVLDAIRAGKLVVLHSGSGKGKMFDNSTNHWILLRGVSADGSKVYINDPYDLPDPGDPNKPKAGGNSLQTWNTSDVVANTDKYDIVSR